VTKATIFGFLALCLGVPPGQAAVPPTNLQSRPADASACGDPARSRVLKQRILVPIREEVLRRTAPNAVTVEERDLQIQTCPQQDAAESEFTVKGEEYAADRHGSQAAKPESAGGNARPSQRSSRHPCRLRRSDEVLRKPFVARCPVVAGGS